MERAAQTFPTLTAAQIERIAAVGRRCSTPAGEILFDLGDQNARFFVVLSGGIEIVQPVGSVEMPIITHGPGRELGGGHVLGPAQVPQFKHCHSPVGVPRRRVPKPSPHSPDRCSKVAGT